jgi:ATP-dependent helicase/nuclease subunit B
MQAYGVGYGEPAARLLRDLVAEAKADDPLAPVTIVVPTDSVGTSTRRALAAGRYGAVGPGSGIAGLYLLTIRRLGELLGAPLLAAAGRRPATTPVLAAAVRQVLADAPGLFEPVAEHPATEEALVRVHRELSDCPEVALNMLAAAGPRAADVVRIHRAVRDRLTGGWYEECDLLDAAGEVVEAGSPVLSDLGSVILHLPQDVTLTGAGLLRALAEHLTTTGVIGLTGVAGADEPVLRSVERLGAELTDRRGTDGAFTTPPHGSAVISVSDADEEVRSAVEEVLAAARRGVPLERIAVLYPSRAPYARALHEHLEAADIPYNGAAVRPLAERVLGRWILELLRLRTIDFDRAAVLRLLTSAPVLARDGQRIPTRVWERISREAGVVRGRDGWDQRLQHFAAQARSHVELAEGQPEAPAWLIDRHRRDADHADGLREFVCGLIDHVEQATTLASWRELSAWAREMIHHYLGDGPARLRWPEPERLAAERVEAAIDGLAGLDEVETDTNLEILRRTLELELEQDLGRTGRLGQGVLVGTPAAALGVDLEVAIVLGMAEGVFPARPHEDPLLNDHERALVADHVPPRRTRIAEQHRQYLAALACTSGARILIHPRGDLRRSARRSPSRWLLDTMEALSGERTGPVHGRPEVTLVASFASRSRGDGTPATAQAYGLRTLDAQLRQGHDLVDHPLVTGGLRRGVELLRGRRRPGAGRFDGILGPAASQVPSPLAADRRISASALERYLGCPHAYLMQDVLRVEAVEYPEELLEISPTDRGSLVTRDPRDLARRATRPPTEPRRTVVRSRRAPPVRDRRHHQRRVRASRGHRTPPALGARTRPHPHGTSAVPRARSRPSGTGRRDARQGRAALRTRRLTARRGARW